MKNIKYKEIAEITNKSVNTIRGWKIKFPELLEVVKLGAFCQKYNISLEQLKKCIEFQEITTKKEEKEEGRADKK